MTTTAIAPKRVLRELTRDEVLSQKLDRLAEVRDQKIARAKADYAQGVIDAVEEFKGDPPLPQNGTHAQDAQAQDNPPAVS